MPERSSFYYGKVNLKNQRNGYGILLTEDKEYFEGNWNKNKFEAYGRIIGINEIITEGKKIYINLYNFF